MIGRGVERQPAETVQINLRPRVRVPARDQRHTAFVGRHEIARHIPGGQPRHAAHHRHRRGEIGAVARLFLAQQEPCQKVHVVGRRGGVQIITVVVRKEALDARRGVIRRRALPDGFGDERAHLVLHIVGDGEVLRGDLGVMRVRGVRGGGDQRLGIVVADAEGQIAHRVFVADGEIARQEQFGGGVVVQYHAVARDLDAARALRRVQRCRRVGEHMDFDRRLRRRARVGARQRYVEQRVAQRGKGRGNVQIAAARQRIVPHRARVHVLRRGAQTHRAVGGHLHHRAVARAGRAAQPRRERQIAVALKREGRAHVVVHQVILDELAQVGSGVGERLDRRAARRQEQQPGQRER